MMLKQGVTHAASIWLQQQRISYGLLGWSVLNAVVGTLLLVFTPPFWQGFGLQSLVWGVIDAGIALFGLYSLRRKRLRPDANTPEVVRLESHNLRRLLLINTGLDVLYVVAGFIVLSVSTTAFGRGNGVGILFQGGFLLLFDAFYATRVKID